MLLTFFFYYDRELKECVKRKNELENGKPVWLVFYGDSKTSQFVSYFASKVRVFAVLLK